MQRRDLVEWAEGALEGGAFAAFQTKFQENTQPGRMTPRLAQLVSIDLRVLLTCSAVHFSPPD